MASPAPERLTNLTDQQRRAVTAGDVSVALSAGAGCGKTFVLTERFLAELEPDSENPARLNQLIAITFTDRAAREMRDRIRAACAGRLRECPEEQVGPWLELIRGLDSARISTIHSFCGSLLRAHAVEARLDPRFRVLDQTQADTLLYELLDEQLRGRLAERDEDMIDLIVKFGLDRLCAMIRKLLARRQEIDWERWRGETPEGLAAIWEDYCRRDTAPRVARQIAKSQPAQTLLQICREHPPTNPTMLGRCRFLAEHLPGLSESTDPVADLGFIYDNAKVQGSGLAKAWPSAEIYEQFRDTAETFRNLIKKRKEERDFDAAAARPAAETALRLLNLTAHVADAYEEKKQEETALDFEDLLIRARDLLAGPDGEKLRKRLAAQTRLLLVDEFQDTDPLQVELVKALCDYEITGGRLFFVGDYKQSIYRFRGAQPHVFRELRDGIPERGRLPLSLNFRSQPAILDFVNALFRDEIGPDYEALRPDHAQVGPTPAVEFLWAQEPEGGDAAPENAGLQEEGETRRLRRLEADWIARRLRAMLDAPEKIVWDDEATREVRPGDVAMLFRSLPDVDLYEDALRRYGIDYYLVGGHAFYSQQEVFDLLNLLRALDSPLDAVSLAGVLRSPFFSLLDETLYWLAGHPGGLSAGLVQDDPPPEIEGDQRVRVAFAARTLHGLRSIKDRLPVAALINEALARTGYDATLLAEFLGERKLANLHKLIEQARSFDRSGIFTLADFITQLSEFVAQQPKEALAATHPESIGAVRLMTIHQSKGLEFPVVVVPDVSRQRQRPTDSVAFTPELGPMVHLRDVPSGLDLYRLAEDDEDLAELVCLFYVATTRAADHLILSSGVKDFEKPTSPWMELLGRRFDLISGALRDSSGVDPKHVPVIKVTTSEPPLGSKTTRGPRRENLPKLIEKARKMAGNGEGRIPPHLAPIPRDAAARRQYSFSRLTGEFHAVDAAAPSDPHEDEPKPAGIPPQKLGDLVHAVLAEVDFRDAGDVTESVRRQAAILLPDVTEELSEPIEMIGRFLASPRAGDIAAAGEVYPELEFLLAWPPGSNDPGGRYLQGFIDCIYRDNDGRWHLVDYKTNRVSEETLAAVAAPYEMQLLIYALAAERILGSRPVELVLHFLRRGLEYGFDWNDGARRRVVEFVETAIRRTL